MDTTTAEATQSNKIAQLELPIEYAVKKVSPDLYKVIHPNVLIEASNMVFKIAEHRLCTEILAHNHKEEPEQLLYSFPYTVVRPNSKYATSNAWRDSEPIINSLQSRVLRLPKEYVEKVYGKKVKRVTFNPFNKVIYENGRFTVRLDEDFKRILVITKDHFTRGELKLLRTLKNDWSHKIYWLIREKQPWKGVLEIGLPELKRKFGVSNKYKGRYNNFKAKVLLPAQKELKNTWAEFEFKESRGGRAGKEVIKIRFMFRDDLKQHLRQEKDLRFNYEVMLYECMIPVHTIHEIRGKIYDEEPILADRPERWDYFYVEQTVDIVRSKKNIKKLPDYLYKSLTEGIFLNEVEKRREFFNPGKQVNIFGEKIDEGNKVKGYTFDQFEGDAREMGLSVEELCKRARYQIVETEDGKFAVKDD